MACGFAGKCAHYNAWWCDVNHNSCSAAKNALENAKSLPAASEETEPEIFMTVNAAKNTDKDKGGRQGKKKGGA